MNELNFLKRKRVRVDFGIFFAELLEDAVGNEFVEVHSLFRLFHQKSPQQISRGGADFEWELELFVLVGFEFVYKRFDVFGTIRRMLEEFLPEKHLVENTANTPKIAFIIVGIFFREIQDYLWSNCVFGAKFGRCQILRNFSEAKVSYFQCRVVDEQILEFNVSVHDVVLSQFYECLFDLVQEINCDVFGQSFEFVVFQIIQEIPVIAVIQDEIVIGLVLV